MRATPIAELRAEWSQLDNPARIEGLAKRYLPLKPIAPTQFDSLDKLPERPPQFFKPDSPDPIGAAIEKLQETETTGGLGAPARAVDMTIRARRKVRCPPQIRIGDAMTAIAQNAGHRPIARWRRLMLRAALRQQDRPGREGAGARRIGDPAVCSRVFDYCDAAGHVRAPHPTAAIRTAPWPATRSRLRGRIFSTATAKSWRPTCACPRSTPNLAV